MEVFDSTRQAWELVHIADFSPCGIVGMGTLYVIEDCCGRQDSVKEVYGFTSYGFIEEEGVPFEIYDLESEEYPP